MRSQARAPNKASPKRSYGSKGQRVYGGHSNDPLDIKLPPQGVRGMMGVRPAELGGEGQYAAAASHPDTLLADVETLLAQEQMLTEQTNWWQERAQKELATRRHLQSDLQMQDASFKQEVANMQQEIASIRNQKVQEEERANAFLKESDDMRSAAAKTREEAGRLKKRLEDLARTQPPGNAAKIRASISAVKGSLAEPTIRASISAVKGSLAEPTKAPKAKASAPLAPSTASTAVAPAVRGNSAAPSSPSTPGNSSLGSPQESVPKASGKGPASPAVGEPSSGAGSPSKPSQRERPGAVPGPLAALDDAAAVDGDGDGQQPVLTLVQQPASVNTGATGLSMDFLDDEEDEEDIDLAGLGFK